MRKQFVLITVAVLAARTVLAQGYAPEEAPGKMTLPEGFRAVLFAAEPVVRQPVCIEFDDRGRLWCVQYLQYPNPAGLKRVSVDRWSRTKYDQVPPPPPKGPKGGDIITILEDLDGDGRADTHKNFLEGLNLCSSIAFGHGGVFVLQAPYLLFYPDRDRDDVPDGDPEVLLEGFGMEDAHSVANSLTWGPDGWLYGTQGSTVTASIRGIEFQQGVWRYHVKDKRFELFCEGGGNAWGLDFNEIGDCFVSTNFGPYLMIHAEQGAYYWKSFGKHGSLHNPYAYGYFDHVTHHNPQGGHVTNGGIVYQGGAYPAEFNGKYIANNLLSHAVYFHDVIPKGSTYETRHAGTLLDSHDASFAPSDLTTGPDGCLYVADWNDARTAHPDPDAEWNKETGRIYKIVYGDPKPLAPFDLRALPANQLFPYLAHNNDWFRRRARVLLASGVEDGLRATLERQIGSPEQFWAAAGTGFVRGAGITHFLDDADPSIRRWAVRMIGQTPEVLETPGLATVLRDLAITERDPHVRAQLAASAQRLPPPFAWPIILGLASKVSDVGDAHLPLLIWWAIEAHAMASPESAISNVLHPGPSHWNNALVMDALLPRLLRRFFADSSLAGEAAAVRVLEQAPSSDLLARILPSVDDGLQDRGATVQGVTQGGLFGASAVAGEHSQPDAAATATVGNALKNTLERLYNERPDDLTRLRLAVRIGNERAYAAAKDKAANGPDRAEAIKLLARFGKADCLDLLLNVLANDVDATLRLEALTALRRFPDEAIGGRLLRIYATADATLKSKVRETVLSRANWARAFLDAVDAGKIDPKEVPPEQLRVVAMHNDAALTALVEKHWGKIRAGTPEEKLAEMRRLNNELNFAKGDPEKGKQVFKDTCLKCHALFGEGGHVGPDLTQANRMDREFLLASLVDPSATVRKEYRQYTVSTKNLNVYTGILGESAPGTVTIYNANAEPTVLPQDEVDTMEESPLSLMPEDLLKTLSGAAVRDLFAYLQSRLPKQE